MAGNTYACRYLPSLHQGGLALAPEAEGRRRNPLRIWACSWQGVVEFLKANPAKEENFVKAMKSGDTIGEDTFTFHNTSCRETCITGDHNINDVLFVKAQSRRYISDLWASVTGLWPCNQLVIQCLVQHAACGQSQKAKVSHFRHASKDQDMQTSCQDPLCCTKAQSGVLTHWLMDGLFNTEAEIIIINNN